MKHYPQRELEVYLSIVSGELEIEDDGTIWRTKKRIGNRSKTSSLVQCARVRAEKSNGDGYLQIAMMRDKKRVYAAAHRLIWLYHKGAIPQGMTINHIDGNRMNNRISNLEVASHSEQRIHACRVLKCRVHRPIGENHPRCTVTENIVLEILYI